MQHGNLFVAKPGQAVGDEMIKGLQRLCAVGGPVKRAQAAKMAGEPGGDHVQHSLGFGIGGKALRFGAQQVGGGGFGVVMVEISLATRRLGPVHQQPGAAPHVAVEPFHPQ